MAFYARGGLEPHLFPYFENLLWRYHGYGRVVRDLVRPWDAVLGAETAGAYKPQPRAYLRTAEMLGLAPERCMMVAAHNGDLAAAAALGFKTAFVRRPNEYGPQQTSDLEPEGVWDIVAEDFLELADKLGC